MKKLISTVALSLGVAAASTGVASPVDAALMQGKGFATLQAPQSVGAPANKIEVIEFFRFGCPSCNEVEPYIEAWKKRQSADVAFKRVPVVFWDEDIPHSKMYHTLVALGVADRLMPEVFHEIHVNKNSLLTSQAQADFFATRGIDKRTYMEGYDAPEILKDLERDASLRRQYKDVRGVPTVVVQGKYMTNPLYTDGPEDVTEMVDVLVQQVREKNM